MSTIPRPVFLSHALFGKARRRVLAALFGHPDEAMYLRQLARAVGMGLGAVQHEVRRLSEAGILLRSVRGNQVYYQANPECPIFHELRGLVLKTAGAAEVLGGALASLADRIYVAFMFGSVVGGQESRASDIDVLVVGSVTFAEVVAATGKAQQELGREVNPVVFPPDEFRRKLAAGHHFLTSVLKTDKLFLIGDQSELARLAEKRVAD